MDSELINRTASKLRSRNCDNEGLGHTWAVLEENIGEPALVSEEARCRGNDLRLVALDINLFVIVFTR